MILFSIDLHFNLYDVNLKSQKILALSSICTLILFNAIFMFLFQIFSLKCFCITMKGIILSNPPSRVLAQLQYPSNLTTFSRGVCWKISMVFPTQFWLFNPLNELIFAWWHRVRLISLSPTSPYGQNVSLRRMSGIVIPWQGLIFEFFQQLMLWL